MNSVVWNKFMKKEIETARMLQNTLQIENKALGNKIKFNFCQKLGHKENYSYPKYPNKQVAKTYAVVTKSITVKPSIIIHLVILLTISRINKVKLFFRQEWTNV